MDNKLTAKIRMYRMHELGDCFFLKFEHEDKKAHVLIDCGSFRNSNTSSQKFQKIASDIRNELDNKPIDLVVATHQHNDHMSGFEYAKSDFEKMGIKQVFLSWLDDETDSLALDIAEKHNKVIKQLGLVKESLNRKEYKELETVGFGLDDECDPMALEISKEHIKILKQILVLRKAERYNRDVKQIARVKALLNKIEHKELEKKEFGLNDESDSWTLNRVKTHNRIVKDLAQVKSILNRKEYSEFDTERIGLDDDLDALALEIDKEHNKVVKLLARVNRTLNKKAYYKLDPVQFELDDVSVSLANDLSEIYNEGLKHLAQLKDILNNKESNELEPVRSALDEVVDERSFSPDKSFTGKATKFLKEVGKQEIRYMKPGEIVEIPGFPKELVRIHVLGPPRNYDEIKSTNPRKGESYDPHLKNILFSIDELTTTLTKSSTDRNFPFNDKYKEYPEVEKKASALTIDQYGNYNLYDNWRQVNHDWLGIAKKFALHLNTYTNNTSLVLAFELVKSGKVLLFVGDAQAGNWRSWDTIKWIDEDPLSMDALYKNTVFYKVGHHGSHNATSKKALDRMVNKDLVAFIPVNKEDPNLKKNNPWRMPAKKLYDELKKKTKGRIARMDEGKIKYFNNNKNEDNWKEDSLTVKDLYVEYTLKDE